ncbi:conserved hypothetical protein [Nitrospina gracilis 3/211]|uniref:Methyltransferase domain-containing protein n=1 Tax=Nitrospina gracilis (strain 3/211) TaxID=1266370 RepID=M1Z2S9_NITG3|nr:MULTISPECIES: hypothetical protein [Nitrospina]MCF8724612.1 hypothetical protein [Nitrospina sp. Nb-3]CCQ91794.1 conserved hypothetical protein [Nitrospina gracilis 3/211]
MPTSTYSDLESVLKFFNHAKPRSLLDIGVGFGKIGFLAREFLDVMMNESYRPADWKVRIDGIEAFSDYIQDHHKALYDSIHIGDAFEVIDGLGKYDAIVLGDSLEHFEKERAWQMLDKCAEHCTGYLMIFIPLGERWEQEAIYGNEYERHLSFWTREEFEPIATACKFSRFEGIGDYGRFLIHVGHYRHHRLRMHADDLFRNGEKDKAIAVLTSGMEGLPVNVESEYQLVDFLLEMDRLRQAVHRLKSIQIKFPNEAPVVGAYIERVEAFLARQAKAS